MHSFKNWLRSLGPGIITAALVFGPSKMTITSRMGASYGYALLWIVVVAIFFMTLFTNMGARIGAAGKSSLLSLVREKWGPHLARIVGVGIFLVTASFQAGNAVGVGISLGEATGTKPGGWILLFTLIGIALLFSRGFYNILEKLMVALVALMLFAFVSTLVMVNPDWIAVASGLEPELPTGAAGLAIAFMASCFSIVGAFYQSYLERQRMTSGQLKAGRPSNSGTGIFILGAMSAVVMICAAGVLHARQIPVTNASTMAMALEPLFGEYATRLFFTGLFAASFSSLVGNATVGGSLLGDAFGWGDGLSSRRVKILIALIMVIGATVAIVFGKLPLEMIVLAQSITIFLVPLIGTAMYTIANDRGIMGPLANNSWQRWGGFAGLLLVGFLAVANIYELFIK